MNRILRLLVLLSCIFISVQTYAQTQIHAVRPGDTFESIAAKYGVDVKALKDANPMLESCHVGAQLQVPFTKKKTTTVAAAPAKTTVPADPYQLMVDGLSLLKQKKYSKAKKQFTQALKIKKIPEAYYYRGLCYYKKSNWKHAYWDFRTVTTTPDIDAKLRSDASDLREYTYAKYQEQLQNRKEAWAEVGKAIGAGLLVAGTIAVGVISQTASSNDSYSSSNSGYGSSRSFYSGSSGSRPVYSSGISSMSSSQFNNYIESEMMGIMAMTIAQVQQQEVNEYQQFSRYNKKADGSDYTMGEFQAMKGQALLNLKEEGVDIVADMQEQSRQDRIARDEQAKKEKAERFERMGLNAPESTKTTSKTSTSTKTTTTASTKSSTSSSKVSESKTEEKLDSKQQFHREPVSSDDYKEVKKVTLFDRDGDTAKVRMQNIELCTKGGHHYIKIGNTYYTVNYSNWGRFNRSIAYGSRSLYFNL